LIYGSLYFLGDYQFTQLYGLNSAAALGADVIEKHFTLDRTLPGPDHKSSLEPEELAEFVRSIRDVEKALGDSRVRPTSSEFNNRSVARKSLVAAVDVEMGTKWTDKNLTVKRPGSGISPMSYWNYLGRPANRSYAANELLTEE
jgi:N-acetylneuraminate synthase